MKNKPFSLIISKFPMKKIKSEAIELFDYFLFTKDLRYNRLTRR
ncbi:hypothetical protein RV18_GL000924 [Enterococcus termitis]|nr:hypothetical protein RV18_GL000924 [Enterococcus termitis]